MIDLKDYRIHPEKYQQGAKNKGSDIDWSLFDKLDAEVRDHKQALDNANAERNTCTAEIEQKKRTGEDFMPIVNKVKELKETIQQLEENYKASLEKFNAILYQIPSPAFDDVIVGKDDSENEVDVYLGEKPTFSFPPKPHREILEDKGYLDQERAVKLSGSRFQIMRGPLAQLQFALIQRVTQKLIKKGFNLALVPQLVKEDALFTTGFLPNDSTNLYRVNPKSSAEYKEWEEDDLWLIGTAEVALVSQHMDEVLDASELPLRYVGVSSCYRREAGTYGKDTKGLIRVHQFDKVEMVTFVKPEDSAKEHEFLREIEEEIFLELGLHFQRINICTGDLGAPAAKKYDLEARFPGMDTYKEVTSTSNTTDFQTRRGNIKYAQDGKKEFVHSLNGTAVAIGRCLAAIVETYQTENGDIRIPEVLQPRMSTDLI